MIKRTVLAESVNEYNKYYGAEAHAQILKQYKKGKVHLLVRFDGPFCFSCAQDEYYTDFQLLLEDKAGLKLRINSVKQESNGAIVDFECEDDQAAVYVSHF